MSPLAATADHGNLILPLDADIVEAMSDCVSHPSGEFLGTTLTSDPSPENDSTAIPPDRKVSGSDNQYLNPFDSNDVGAPAVHANADQDSKETTLDISGSHNVIDGHVNSRSHLKIGGTFNLLREGTTYGTRSVGGKQAFLLSGQKNCFGMEPEQIAQNAPQAPDGFPEEQQFDPDGDGNVLEHFNNVDDPGDDVELAGGVPAANYFFCKVGSSQMPPGGESVTGLKCSEGDGKLESVRQLSTMPTGFYYVEGEVALSASNLTATVTIVSGKKLKVNGSVQGQFVNVFSPYPPLGDLLFASQWDLAANSANTDKGDEAVKIEGSLSRFEGIIVAVNGTAQMAGSRLQTSCPFMGDDVVIDGSKNYISGEECGKPGITVEKKPDGAGDVGGEIEAGDQATFTIKVKNNGSSPATDVVLSDTLPDTNLTWTLISGPAGCSITNDDLTCNIGTLNAGEEVTIVVQSSATSSASHCVNIENGRATLDNGSLQEGELGDAIVTAAGGLKDTDPGHIIIKCPNPTVEKTPDEGTNPTNDVNAGQFAVFTVTVTNPGPGTASSVTLDDNLPAGFTWEEVPGSDVGNDCNVGNLDVDTPTEFQDLQCDFGSMAEGDVESVQIRAPTTVANCGTITNLVTITAAGDIDTTPDSNTDTGEIDIICGAIKIVKNSTKGDLVATAGAVFSVAGPAAGTADDFSVTDASPAAGLDEDGDIGEICVDNLQPGGIYTVNETTPPPGYGAATQTNVAITAVAGNCPNAPFTEANTATFVNPPLFDIQVRFRDGGSGETELLPAGLDCNNPTGAESSADQAPLNTWDDTLTIEDIQVPVAGEITITCTIPVDP